MDFFGESNCLLNRPEHRVASSVIFQKDRTDFIQDYNPYTFNVNISTSLGLLQVWCLKLSSGSAFGLSAFAGYWTDASSLSREFSRQYWQQCYQTLSELYEYFGSRVAFCDSTRKSTISIYLTTISHLSNKPLPGGAALVFNIRSHS